MQGHVLPHAFHALMQALAGVQVQGFYARILGTHASTAHFSALTGPLWEPYLKASARAPGKVPDPALSFALPRPISRVDYSKGGYSAVFANI
mmetsp:Transcript_70168/g.117768  ORF Transcript_70168/g.117768 Transcript_70168/m.117768 type:complete len:92 (+) Transcript_70168:3-278(+)